MLSYVWLVEPGMAPLARYFTCCWFMLGGNPRSGCPHTGTHTRCTQSLRAPPPVWRRKNPMTRQKRQRWMAGLSTRLCSGALNFVLHSQIVVTAGVTPSCGHRGRHFSGYPGKTHARAPLCACWKQHLLFTVWNPLTWHKSCLTSCTGSCDLLPG